MAEKSRKAGLFEVEAESYKTFVMEVQCMCCCNEENFTGDTIEEVQKNMTDEGWKYLESDLLKAEGWWCGCDYLNEI